MARHHEAVAWLRRAARSCWAACFLIELRCALWASPPSITAFVLPAVTFHHIESISFSAFRSHPVFGIKEPVRFQHLQAS